MYEFERLFRRKEQSPFPTVKTDRLYVFNWCIRDCGLAMAGLNSRGILTPACALAQNDSSIVDCYNGSIGRALEFPVILRSRPMSLV